MYTYVTICTQIHPKFKYTVTITRPINNGDTALMSPISQYYGYLLDIICWKSTFIYIFIYITDIVHKLFVIICNFSTLSHNDDYDFKMLMLS